MNIPDGFEKTKEGDPRGVSPLRSMYSRWRKDNPPYFKCQTCHDEGEIFEGMSWDYLFDIPKIVRCPASQNLFPILGTIIPCPKCKGKP